MKKQNIKTIINFLNSFNDYKLYVSKSFIIKNKHYCELCDISGNYTVLFLTKEQIKKISRKTNKVVFCEIRPASGIKRFMEKASYANDTKWMLVYLLLLGVIFTTIYILYK